MIKALLLFVCPLLSWGDVVKWQPQSEEEALFINRIADFWEEEEYLIAKNQIEEFLQIYPNSAFADSFYSALGNLYLREEKPSQALECYAKIKDPEIASLICLYRLQCLHSLKQYAALVEESLSLVESPLKSNEEREQITYHLAIGLYHLCLEAQKEGNAFDSMAGQAASYFETLLETPFKNEVMEVFAHLCCLLKDFPRAASLYLDLAEKSNCEDNLLQTAFIQAQYDKELALQTLKEIMALNGPKQQDAAYQSLVLLFDLKKYESLLEAKEEILAKIPKEKRGFAQLCFGKSLLALQREEEACAMLKAFLSPSYCEDNDLLKSALTALFEASFQTQDITLLENALDLMRSFDPQSREYSQGRFLKALLLRQKNEPLKAQAELGDLLLSAQEENLEQQILLELVSISYEEKNWEACRKNALKFLSQFPSHHFSSNIEEAFILSSSELANAGLLEKEIFLSDLETLLAKKEEILPKTKTAWQFLMAKTYIDLNQKEKAVSLLQELCETLPKIEDSVQSANVYLLLALCYQEEEGSDHPLFCATMEKVLSILKDTPDPTFDIGAIHVSLYNAYLDAASHNPDMLGKAAEHLFAAFGNNSLIQKENLLWLAEHDCKNKEKEEGVFAILQYLLQQNPSEKERFKICQLLVQIEKNETAIGILEASPKQNEASLLLGELYLKQGMPDKALSLFNSILQEKAILKTELGASACLQSARIQANQWINKDPSLEDPQFQQVLLQLKNLLLQKNISYEPLYLEASLDYIDLQNRCHKSALKKLSLLQKTKQDFESEDDLLSKDYHLARKELLDKDRIFQSYMTFLKAQILLLEGQLDPDEMKQKELQAKAKNLLLKVIEEQAYPALVARANECLNL